MALNMDKQSRILYFSTIAVLSTGLFFAAVGPLLGGAKEPIEVSAAQTAAPNSLLIQTIAPDPLLAFQIDRAALREQERLSLKQVMEDPSIDSPLVAQAGARLMRILDWTEQEHTIEGVLRSRGYEDCVVTVHQDSANVLIRGDSPTRQQAAQILELVCRETGLGGGDIKIIPIP